MPTSGEVWLEGTQINAPETNVNKVREHIGMVFQSFNLFPHLTAKGNVMLAQRKVPVSYTHLTLPTIYSV